MPIRITDDVGFLRVRDTTAGTLAMLNKGGVFSKDNGDGTFALDSYNFSSNFSLTDVEKPAADSVEELLNTLTLYAGLETRSVANHFPPRVLIRDMRDHFVPASVQLQQLKTDDADVTFEPLGSFYKLRITDTNSTRVVRQSRQYTRPTFITDVIVTIQAVLTDGNATSNVTSRVGVFDQASDVTVNGTTSGNGVFFQVTDGKLYVTQRDHTKSPSDTVVAQADWNIDSMNGNGPSNFLLDATLPQVYVVHWRPSWNLVSLGLFSNDSISYCHEFSWDGRVRPLTEPVRWEITQTKFGDDTAVPAAAAYMKQGRAAVYYDRISELALMPNVHTVSTDLNTVELKESRVLLALRVREEHNRVKLIGNALHLLDVSGKVARWKLLFNPTLSGAVWQPAQNESLSEVSLDASMTASGGAVVASGILYTKSDAEHVDMQARHLFLASDISGKPDVWALVIEAFSQRVDVSASLTWTEAE